MIDLGRPGLTARLSGAGVKFENCDTTVGGKIMSAQWINTIGLVADIIGVTLLSWGLFASKETAIILGATRWAGDTDDENLTLPAVVDRLRQSRFAKFGLPILVAGFGCQIAATWIR